MTALLGWISLLTLGAGCVLFLGIIGSLLFRGRFERFVWGSAVIAIGGAMTLAIVSLLILLRSRPCN